MGATKGPADYLAVDFSEAGNIERRDDQNLEVFEIAGQIKWFDASKG